MIKAAGSLLVGFFGDDWHKRKLVINLLRRRVEAKFRGSVIGTAWVVILPLAMLAVYTLVFEHFLKVRWPGAVAGSGVETALRIYLGLLVLNFFAENLSVAPQLILEHQQFVKKIVFPLPVLAYVAVLASLLPYLLGFAVALVLLLFSSVSAPASLHLVPVVVLTLLFWGLAIQWWLAAVGVFVRDLGHMVGPLISLLMFLSPIFYDRSSIPAPWRDWLLLNPLTVPIESLRHIFFATGQLQEFALLLNLLIAMLLAVVGRAFFVRLQSGFADVI